MSIRPLNEEHCVTKGDIDLSVTNASRVCHERRHRSVCRECVTNGYTYTPTFVLPGHLVLQQDLKHHCSDVLRREPIRHVIVLPQNDPMIAGHVVVQHHHVHHHAAVGLKYKR